MSRFSKRLRRYDACFTVDPMERIHEHLHEMIFQHFDASDVIISSETNKKWFDTIGASKRCMKQVNLGLDNWWQNETSEDIGRVMKIVKRSTRRYQNVHINSNDDEKVSQRSYQLLKFLAPSLVDVKFLNTDGITLREQFKFPRLERLQFINNVSAIDELFLHGSTQLKELNLKHHYWAEPEPVLDCLKANKHLTMLKLWDTGISKLFEIYEPNCFEFKLKKFATGADGTIAKETEEKFLHFLETQSDHLEAIRFRSGLDGVNAAIINKVFEMSAMKIIHLDGVGNLNDLKLPINTRIIELRLCWSVDTLEKLLPFLRAVPKLKVLFIRKINKEILEYVAMHLKELKLLYFTRAEGCMGCFKKYLSMHEDSNKDIELVSKEWF